MFEIDLETLKTIGEVYEHAETILGVVGGIWKIIRYCRKVKVIQKVESRVCILKRITANYHEVHW